MQACRPEEVIEQFAQFSKNGVLTRGEQGLVVTMNTRWLPHYVRLRQMLGMAPIRYDFAATSHDPLAQSPGIFTFFFDVDHQIWQCLGATETGARRLRCRRISDCRIRLICRPLMLKFAGQVFKVKTQFGWL